MINTLSKKRSVAGRRGGNETLRRHGAEHFKKIGEKGARTFHARYRFTPTGLNDFAIANRATGEVVAFLSGRPWK